ncbi:DUF3800 domain-containing protein [Spiroplasma endosymbiont of Labia minor]|uniref:DUF3800 domain-containing protein n=1 Tax=Spiroplasma endosymbiont of Labia minor TaxID=3066305 RepID=UPI0030D03C0D
MEFLNRKVFIALDESGKFNANDVGDCFIIGGIMYSNKEEIKSAIRIVEMALRKKYKLKNFSEIKGNNTPAHIIADYINAILLNLDDTYVTPIFSVVSRKQVVSGFTINESIAYNFFVNNLVNFWQKRLNFDNKIDELTLLIDERNLKEVEVNDLEVLLKSNFIEHPWTVTSYYLESSKTDVIRFADVLNHVIYSHFNNPDSDKTNIYKNMINKKIYDRLIDGCFYYPYEKSWFKKN